MKLKPENRDRLINAARDVYADDDTEIDDNAEFSMGGGIDRGVWVQAWVYVRPADLPAKEAA